MWRMMAASVKFGPVRALELVGVLSGERERDVVETEDQIKPFHSRGQRTGSLWLRFGLRENIPSWNRREGGKWYASNGTHNSNTVPWIWDMVSKDF